MIDRYLGTRTYANFKNLGGYRRVSYGRSTLNLVQLYVTMITVLHVVLPVRVLRGQGSLGFQHGSWVSTWDRYSKFAQLYC